MSKREHTVDARVALRRIDREIVNNPIWSFSAMLNFHPDSILSLPEAIRNDIIPPEYQQEVGIHLAVYQAQVAERDTEERRVLEEQRPRQQQQQQQQPPNRKEKLQEAYFDGGHIFDNNAAGSVNEFDDTMRRQTDHIDWSHQFQAGTESIDKDKAVKARQNASVSSRREVVQIKVRVQIKQESEEEHGHSEELKQQNVSQEKQVRKRRLGDVEETLLQSLLSSEPDSKKPKIDGYSKKVPVGNAGKQEQDDSDSDHGSHNQNSNHNSNSKPESNRGSRKQYMYIKHVDHNNFKIGHSRDAGTLRHRYKNTTSVYKHRYHRVYFLDGNVSAATVDAEFRKSVPPQIIHVWSHQDPEDQGGTEIYSVTVGLIDHHFENWMDQRKIKWTRSSIIPEHYDSTTNQCSFQPRNQKESDECLTPQLSL